MIIIDNNLFPSSKVIQPPAFSQPCWPIGEGLPDELSEPKERLWGASKHVVKSFQMNCKEVQDRRFIVDFEEFADWWVVCSYAWHWSTWHYKCAAGRSLCQIWSNGSVPLRQDLFWKSWPSSPKKLAPVPSAWVPTGGKRFFPNSREQYLKSLNSW